MRRQRIYCDRKLPEPEFTPKRMRQLRGAACLTQLELAELTSYSKTYIGELERGEKPLKGEVLERLRVVLVG